MHADLDMSSPHVLLPCPIVGANCWSWTPSIISCPTLSSVPGRIVAQQEITSFKMANIHWLLLKLARTMAYLQVR